MNDKDTDLIDRLKKAETYCLDMSEHKVAIKIRDAINELTRLRAEKIKSILYDMSR